MLAWMAAKWLIMPSWAKSALKYIGIALVVLLAIRWYGNQQYYQGKQAERMQIAQEQARAKQEEWKQQEEAIVEEKETVDTDRQFIEAERSKNAQMRRSIESTLTNRLNEILLVKEAADAATIKLEPSQLVDAIRARSRELYASPSPIHR